MNVPQKKLSLSEQAHLLAECMKKGLSLDKELRDLGCTYDDLHYRRNGFRPQMFPRREMPEPTQRKPNDIPALSFFAGAGGMDIGFEAAGFAHLGAFELNATFCQTLRRNRPRWVIFGPPNYTGDLRNGEETRTLLRKVIGSRAEFDGVFHGGPPCQSFSIAANQRFAKWGKNFKRIGFAHGEYGSLLFDYIGYILEFRPRVFLLENVPGLATVDNGTQLAAALRRLECGGYKMTGPLILDASEYGVPQYRERLIVVGCRSGRSFRFPPRESMPVTCGDALRPAMAGLANHQTRKHSAQSIARYMELAYGQRYDLGRVDRLDPEAPSKTVIAGGSKGGGRSHLHHSIPRTLSVRESARLQTFPDDYVFCGSGARQFTQVGNALPPLLATKLATAIHDTLFS